MPFVIVGINLASTRKEFCHFVQENGQICYKTSWDWYYIEICHKLKESTTQIASTLGRSQSTISGEIRCNQDQRGYRHKQAHRKVQQRHADKSKAIKLTPPLVDQIDTMLKQQWRPEQISGRLKYEGSVSVHKPVTC